MHATTGADHQGAGVLHQADRAGLGVAEGNAGTGHQIDPVLQLGRDVEVVHGGRDDHQIARLELGHQLVGLGQHGQLTLIQVFATAQAHGQLAVEHRQIQGCQITHSDAVTLALGQVAVDQGVGLGILAQDAGLENEDIGHGETPFGCRLNSLAVDGGHYKD
ncbi:hypothetical protein D3C75_523770 [compost metagenome]